MTASPGLHLQTSTTNSKTLLTFALLSSAASAADWSLTPLVLEGQTIPNGNTITSITNLAINNGLDWRVEAGSTGGLGSVNVLMDANGIVAQAGQAMIAPAGATLGSFDALTLDINGNSAGTFSSTERPVRAMTAACTTTSTC